MKADELFEELYEFKSRNGILEIKLFTQRDTGWEQEQYDIHEVYYSDKTYTGDCDILIEGEDGATKESDSNDS